MANVNYKDGSGSSKYFKATGAGSDGDPNIVEHLETNSASILSSSQSIQSNVGATNENVASTDTATSGLNGLLKRVNQRLTALIALFPTSLGQKTKDASFPVVLASNQDALAITDNSGSLTVDGTVAATQSGTWTISNITNPVAITDNSSSLTVDGTVSVGTITLPTTIYNGQKNVTTAGTRVTLASSQAITSGVRIKAKSSNTGVIYVGDSSVTSSTGFILAASEEVFLEVANLATVNLDSSVSGEGVSYIAT